MERKKCFDPLLDYSTKILIIGTFPGEESLHQGCYYGNKKNHFWDIIYRCIDPTFDFFSLADNIEKQTKYQFLLRNRIGLWDIVESCTRSGSSDKNILNPKFNSLTGLTNQYTSISKVIFNGKNAANLYLRSLKIYNPLSIPHLVVNSTSTLNPNNTFNVLNQWREMLSTEPL